MKHFPEIQVRVATGDRLQVNASMSTLRPIHFSVRTRRMIAIVLAAVLAWAPMLSIAATRHCCCDDQRVLVLAQIGVDSGRCDHGCPAGVECAATCALRCADSAPSLLGSVPRTMSLSPAPTPLAAATVTWPEPLLVRLDRPPIQS